MSYTATCEDVSLQNLPGRLSALKADGYTVRTINLGNKFKLISYKVAVDCPDIGLVPFAPTDLFVNQSVQLQADIIDGVAPFTIEPVGDPPSGMSLLVDSNKGDYFLSLINAPDTYGLTEQFLVRVVDSNGCPSNQITVDSFAVGKVVHSDNESNAVTIANTLGWTGIASMYVEGITGSINLGTQVLAIGLRMTIPSPDAGHIGVKLVKGHNEIVLWNIGDLSGDGVDCSFSPNSIQNIADDSAPYHGLFYVDLSSVNLDDPNGTWTIQVETDGLLSNTCYFNDAYITFIPTA